MPRGEALLQNSYLIIINSMKAGGKQGSFSGIACKQHKQKCSFVCLFRTCSNAFKIGCARCRKEHSQHPNRLISITDFHFMLSKPIKYLQNATAFKLMNLKKKIQYIRNFRTDILQKEVQLMDSNKSIKSIILSILQEHYSIRDTVSHIHSEAIVNNFEDYSEKLQKCKQFLAYNPVKGELVFNNEVIKNSRIALQKHLKNSHDVIDNLREFLVKIIEVLIANCAYDEDDEELQFAQEGDGATSFNIFIKNRTDVTEVPNIKSKLQQESFLQMFDDEKEALTKHVDILEKEIENKSFILSKIKSSMQSEKQRSEIEEVKQEEQFAQASNNASIPGISIEEIMKQNNRLREELTQLKSGLGKNQNIDSSYSVEKDQSIYESLLTTKAKQFDQLKESYQLLEKKLSELKNTKNGSDKDSLQSSYSVEQPKKQMSKLVGELSRQKQTTKSLQSHIKQLQNRFNELTVSYNKQNNEAISTVKKIGSLENQLNKRKQQYESQKQALKTTVQQLQKRLSELSGKLTKREEEIDKREKDIVKEKKRYGELQKAAEKLKQNCSFIQKQYQKSRDQSQNREKFFRSELQKCQKQLQASKYKTRNDEQRSKNLQSKLRELGKDLQVKSEMIRQKDRLLRQKQQHWQSKSTINTSRVKQLQIQLKNSRNNEGIIKSYEDELRKHKDTKQLLEMSIKQNQQLKDRNYELQEEVQQLKFKLLPSKLSPSKSSHMREEERDRSPVKSVLFGLQDFKIETVASQQLIQSRLNQQPNILGKVETLPKLQHKSQEYYQIMNLFKAVTNDMGILEQRLKENNVIEKVYLKQLQRKRNQNKLLKKQLQSAKLYGGNKSAVDISPLNTQNAKVKSPQNDFKATSPAKHKLQGISYHKKANKITFK